MIERLIADQWSSIKLIKQALETLDRPLNLPFGFNYIVLVTLLKIANQY